MSAIAGAPAAPGISSFFATKSSAAASHSLIRRLPAGLDAPAVRANLLRATERFPLLQDLQLWDERLRGPSTDSSSEARRLRELGRAVDGKRTPLRAVLLAYADGAVDLVLVGHRAVVDGQALTAVATLLVDPEHDVLLPQVLDRDAITPRDTSPAPIPWALGDPARAGRVGAVHLSAPAPAGEPLLVLIAAMRLALSRYGGTTPFAVLVSSSNAPDDIKPVAVEMDGQASLADLLHGAQLAELEIGAVEQETAIGLVYTDFGAQDRYQPNLAPIFPMTVGWWAEHGKLRSTLTYDEGFVDPAVAEQFGRHLCLLVERFRATPDDKADEVALVDEQEALALLAVGRTAVPGNTPARTIQETFAEVAGRDPAAVALSDAEQELTYGELDARAAVVASALRDLGVAPGAHVGVCLERTVDLVVTLLGVLKAGAAYVPMDPAYPADRLSYTVADAGIKVVVTTAPDFPVVEGVRLVRPVDLLTSDEAAVDIVVDPDATAYVIYTSGSTGRPKGVAVPHRNVAALLAATTSDMRLSSSDVWTLFHSSAFDFSVWEIWGCLLTGGHLVVVPYWVSRSPEEFHDLLSRRRVTVLNQTPSAFVALRDVALRDPKDIALRLVIFGGEALDVRVLEPWFHKHPHTRCRVVNMFGITETTVHVTAQTITPAEVAARSRSVGRALPGWSVSVRDYTGRPQPLGVPGEIYVGGEGVASHYLNLPELTEERFVTDPISGERVYRSGDLGRLHPGGRLDHLGRIDSQVKLRGFRIELDEIRAVLLDDPVVTAAVVVLDTGDGNAASARLDAYFVAHSTVRTEDVRRRVARFLPEHMVPSTFTALDEIPLTVNGKVDVARLRPASPKSAPTTEKPQAEGTLGKVLAAWREVLGDDVQAKDDFFESGGNSLLAVRLSGALHRSGLPPVSMRKLYVNPTPSALAAVISAASRG